MKERMLRIIVCLAIWLVPVAGIYFGTQILHNTLGIILAIVSGILLMPLSGILFDAVTSDRVLCLNVYCPWRSHLRDRE